MCVCVWGGGGEPCVKAFKFPYIPSLGVSIPYDSQHVSITREWRGAMYTDTHAIDRPGSRLRARARFQRLTWRARAYQLLLQGGGTAEPVRGIFLSSRRWRENAPCQYGFSSQATWTGRYITVATVAGGGATTMGAVAAFWPPEF